MATLLERLRARDTTLWPDGNVAATRLGWIDLPDRMRHEAANLQTWADSIERTRVVLLGMGGSSLGPEVLRAAADSDRLIVLDTTDPATIASVDPDGAFFLVSSKSGGTLEVRTLLAYFWERCPVPSRYAAITDPGTELAKLAAERGFSRTFENPPDIGGRYSVLSYFGLVPAALLGYDIGALCAAALDVDAMAAIELGVAMGEAARDGRDKVTIKVPPPFAAFGLWVEQLIAESTGKQGTGCIPVPTTEVELGEDRFEVAVHIGRAVELGAAFYRWELATAAAGHVLNIDPFNEPNVAESKANTARVLEALPLPSIDAISPHELFARLTDTVVPRDYVSLQAYQPYGHPEVLEGLRRKVRDHLGGLAVTAGYGPRFLHSTGQLHKGGPNTVVAVQLVRTSPSAISPIPGYPYDFGTLIEAQSIGDHQSLESHGRRVLRVAVDDLTDIG
jgi:glucose-6-phosphate isomerase/transaldolase/glucose-6-phosphate isomerase